jgi:hypothetical protein
MKKKTIIAALVAVFLLTAVVTAYALTWTRVRTWSNQYVQQSRFNCLTLPLYTGYVKHKLVLHPIDADVDLYVYGYNGSWQLISSSAFGGMVNDSVYITAAQRTTYNTIIACAWGFGGNSRFNLNYFVGS